MKIWLRTSKQNLTHARTVFGISISYDELAYSFNRMGILCEQEYPEGNAFDEGIKRHIPPKKEEYLQMWYGNPKWWQLENVIQVGEKFFINTPRGAVTYCCGGEMPFEGYDKLAMMDAVFVGSTSAREYHKQKLDPTTEIFVLSGGYLVSQFYPIFRDFNAKNFIFLHVGSTQWRKGSEIACEAFCSAFPLRAGTEASPLLKIITPGATEEFERLRDKYRHDNRLIFEVKVVSDRNKVLREYYEQGHVLVYPSILEGWGRCLTEAMASGMPCIVSRCSAMLDQFNSDCGWWIKLSEQREGEYYLPDVKDLALQMRNAYENRDECQKKGENASKFAKQYLTWETGIGNALPVLNAIYDTEKLSSVQTTDWPHQTPLQLNIGCDMLPLDNWINIDVRARAIRGSFAGKGRMVPKIYQYNYLNPFPFEDNTVSGITISPVPFLYLISDWQVISFLKECFRVLIPKGVIRITDILKDNFHFPSLSYHNAETIMKLLEDIGFRSYQMSAKETNYFDQSICISAYDCEPKVFFVEGVKP